MIKIGTLLLNKFAQNNLTEQEKAYVKEVQDFLTKREGKPWDDNAAKEYGGIIDKHYSRKPSKERKAQSLTIDRDDMTLWLENTNTFYQWIMDAKVGHEGAENFIDEHHNDPVLTSLYAQFSKQMREQNEDPSLIINYDEFADAAKSAASGFFQDEIPEGFEQQAQMAISAPSVIGMPTAGDYTEMAGSSPGKVKNKNIPNPRKKYKKKRKGASGEFKEAYEMFGEELKNRLNELVSQNVPVPKEILDQLSNVVQFFSMKSGPTPAGEGPAFNMEGQPSNNQMQDFPNIPSLSDRLKEIHKEGSVLDKFASDDRDITKELNSLIDLLDYQVKNSPDVDVYKACKAMKEDISKCLMLLENQD